MTVLSVDVVSTPVRQTSLFWTLSELVKQRLHALCAADLKNRLEYEKIYSFSSTSYP